MADDITLSTNIGSGAVIATEDEGSVHYQKIKLTASGSGTTENLSKAEDSAHTTGEHGIMALGVRRDADTTLVGTDGDYSPFQVDVNGRVKVEIFYGGDSFTVDNAGTFAVQAAATNAGTFVVQEDGAALTALQLIDDCVYVDDADWTALTSKHILTGGVYQATPGTITDGDTGPIRLDVNGHIITSAHANSIALADNVSNTANIEVDEAGAFKVSPTMGYYYDGSTWDRIRGDATNGLTVNLGANNDVTATLGAETTKVIGTVNVAAAQTIAVTNAGTFATQATLQSNSGVDIGDVDILSIAAGDNNIGNVDIVTLPASTNTLEVVGDVAHDAAAAGNPVLIGSRATSAVETLTEVANADASFVATDLQGVLITRPYIAAQEHVQYHVVNTAGTELVVTGLDAGGAGIHNYITSVIVHNAHATTNGFIQLLDGSAGTPMATFPAPALGGSVINFAQPLKQTTANTALYWDASAAITTLYVTIIGYQGQG